MKVDILIVEDSATQALMLKELLEEHQMHVRVATDGVEALKIIQCARPQVIISDIEMPNMNGYELCKKIKTDIALKSIPVILLTGLKDPVDAIRGIECGANSFLTKPCDTEVLLSTITNALENSRLSKGTKSDYKMEFFFSGQKHSIQVDQAQVTELLLSTYSNAVQQNLELETAYRRLNELYDEVKKKNIELKALDEQKNKFLGMAAHDMRNPLGAIEMFCDLLMSKLNGEIDPKSHGMIERIKSNSVFMLHLINELLDISTIESGALNLNMVDADIASLIVEAIEYLSAVAEKKQISVKFVNEGDITKLHCDPNKVMQIVNNLVTNAVKFSHPGSEVTVILRPSSFETTIIVKDQGVGMSDEMKKKLFQPFVKGTNPGTSGEKGTGLGLAIVQKIVSEHKGTIRLESEPDKGTTFFVTFPNHARQ